MKGFHWTDGHVTLCRGWPGVTFQRRDGARRDGFSLSPEDGPCEGRLLFGGWLRRPYTPRAHVLSVRSSERAAISPGRRRRQSVPVWLGSCGRPRGVWRDRDDATRHEADFSPSPSC